jgi:hypothetical protein
MCYLILSYVNLQVLHQPEQNCEAVQNSRGRKGDSPVCARTKIGTVPAPMLPAKLADRTKKHPTTGVVCKPILSHS